VHPSNITLFVVDSSWLGHRRKQGSFCMVAALRSKENKQRKKEEGGLEKVMLILLVYCMK